MQAANAGEAVAGGYIGGVCRGRFTNSGAIPAPAGRRMIVPPRSPRVAPWRRSRSEGGVQPSRVSQARQRGSASQPG